MCARAQAMLISRVRLLAAVAAVSVEPLRDALSAAGLAMAEQCLAAGLTCDDADS